MIKLKAEQIDKAESLLSDIPGAAPKAMAGAINRAVTSSRTEASRKVREKYYVKHKDVISTIKLYRASSGDLSGMIISRGHLLALTKFRVTPKRPQPKRKSPVKVRVKRGEGGPIKNAFVARMQSGHTGVFARVGKQRLPIQERFGPSVPQMLDSRDVREWVEQKASEILDKRLEHEINRRLEGKG